MRALFLLIVLLGVLATPARAQSLQIIGHAGQLGEWELSGSLTGKVLYRTKEFSGPVTMRHTGICTNDGPEEKTAEIRLQLSESSSRIRATLSVDGVECTYRGRLTHAYTGAMECPDKGAVPLILWLR